MPRLPAALSLTAITIANRLASALSRVCSAHTAAGTIWPIDAALRPEGKAGPLVRTLASHRAYYEKWAKNWEFQAMLKARPMAGDLELAREFVDMVAPLVWHVAENDQFVSETQAMRRRVISLLPAREADREIKLGAGGLRDVEFSVQLIQLVHGRADERVRQAGTLAAGVLTLGLVFSAVCALPAAAPYLQAGYLVKHLPTPLPQDARVAEWRTYSQSIGFYTGRRMVLVDKSGELSDRIGKPDGPAEWFPSGAESLERLARERSVLLNLNRENWGDWCRTKASGLYRPIAANSVYVLLGNDALIAAMGLRPWPLESVTKPPVLLPARTQAG